MWHLEYCFWYPKLPTPNRSRWVTTQATTCGRYFYFSIVVIMSLIREYLLLKSPPESQKSTWHDELCLELLWLWRLNSFFDEADTTSPSFGDQHLFTGPVGQCQGAISEFGALTFALSRTVGTSWPLAAEKRNRKRRRKLVRCRCSIHDSTSSFCHF